MAAQQVAPGYEPQACRQACGAPEAFPPAPSCLLLAQPLLLLSESRGARPFSPDVAGAVYTVVLPACLPRVMPNRASSFPGSPPRLHVQ